MVKDDGLDEVQSGEGRYFLFFDSYSISRDPVDHKSQIVYLVVPIKELIFNKPGMKQDIPIHPDCKIVDLDKSAVKELQINAKEEHGEEGCFHLKSQGITIFTENAQIDENKIVIQITDINSEGIVDGANLYNVLKNLRVEDVSKTTYVRVTVFDNSKKEITEEIVYGLSRTLHKQNKQEIDNSEMQWITDVLNTTEYKETLDILTILSYINLFRNNYDADVANQPTVSYSNKERVFELYKDNPQSFKKYQSIIKDILYLHDFIQLKSQEVWPSKKGSIGSLGITYIYKQKGYEFPMLNKKADYKLHESVSMILLAALRNFVIFNPDGKAIWSKEFSKILSLYEIILPDLITIIKDFNAQIGNNPHLLGKNSLLYSNIYKEVLMGDMLNQFL